MGCHARFYPLPASVPGSSAARVPLPPDDSPDQMHEEVYLRAYDSVAEARGSIAVIWPSTTVRGLIRA